ARCTTTLSGCATPGGCRNSVFTTLKIAVFAPIPSASVNIAIAANPGVFAIIRPACRIFCVIVLMFHLAAFVPLDFRPRVHVAQASACVPLPCVSPVVWSCLRRSALNPPSSFMECGESSPLCLSPLRLCLYGCPILPALTQEGSAVCEGRGFSPPDVTHAIRRARATLTKDPRLDEYSLASAFASRCHPINSHQTQRLVIPSRHAARDLLLSFTDHGLRATLTASQTPTAAHTSPNPLSAIPRERSPHESAARFSRCGSARKRKKVPSCIFRIRRRACLGSN